ncbi:MAG: YCF48-related protein [Proteobacteria bacterium]|nr:YCF48-related protein [Pseudomonadota bacterium]
MSSLLNRLALQRFRARSARLSIIVLSMVLVSCMAHAEQESIEVVRTGIAHDALFALDMNGEKGVAVGNFGLIMETVDSGATWTKTEPVTDQGLLGVATAGDRQIIVGQGGVVVTRVGDGKWEVLENDIGLRLLNVDIHESGLVVAVGEFGAIRRSRDNGKTWDEITIDWGLYNDEGYEPHLYDVKIRDANTVVVTGEFGLVLWSQDGGDTFLARHQGDESLFAIHLDADGTGSSYAVGQDGEVLRSQDEGQTWVKLNAGSTSNLLGVWSGQGEVVIVGIRELLRSSDDGETWKRSDDFKVLRTWYQGIDAGVAEIEAPNGFLRTQVLYIAGYNATISRILE